MPLFTENTDLENQSHQLWQTYLDDQQKADDNQRFYKDFWTNYNALIKQSRNVQVPRTIHIIQQDVAIESIGQIFFKHWEKPFNLMEHIIRYQSKAPKAKQKGWIQHVFYAFLTLMFISGVAISLLVDQVSGMLLIFAGIVGSLISASSMGEVTNPNVHYKMDNKVILNQKTRFGTTCLHYQFYSPLQAADIQIRVPYASISSIWQDKWGLKLVGSNHKALWKDINSRGAHEVILPNEKQLRSFLSDLTMFNYTQNSIT